MRRGRRGCGVKGSNDATLQCSKKDVHGCLLGVGSRARASGCERQQKDLGWAAAHGPPCEQRKVNVKLEWARKNAKQQNGVQGFSPDSIPPRSVWCFLSARRHRPGAAFALALERILSDNFLPLRRPFLYAKSDLVSSRAKEIRCADDLTRCGCCAGRFEGQGCYENALRSAWGSLGRR